MTPEYEHHITCAVQALYALARAARHEPATEVLKDVDDLLCILTMIQAATQPGGQKVREQ